MLTEEQKLAVATASWAVVTYDAYAVARCGDEYLAGEGIAEMLAEFLWPEDECPHEHWDEQQADSMPILRLPMSDINLWYPRLKAALAGRFMVVQDVRAFGMEHPPDYIDRNNPWFQDLNSGGHDAHKEPGTGGRLHSAPVTQFGDT